jgi:hypothetical protein
MKKIYSLLFLVSFCSILSAQNRYITIGNGGGFSGSVTIFKITPDGKVLKGKGLVEIKYAEYGKLKKRKVSTFIKSISKQTSSLNFNHPGNLYYFLSYSEDGKERKVIWGDSSHSVNESIQKLYDDIVASLNTVRFKPNP